MRIQDKHGRFSLDSGRPPADFVQRARLATLVTLCLLSPPGVVIGAETAKTPPGFPDTQPNQEAPDSAQRSLSPIQLPAGFAVTLFAGEPDISQPIAMTIDDRGRLWVAQCFTSPDWVETETGPDRILILTDTDQDGRFDSKRVFAENLPNLTGIEVGMGGVWACCAPNLLFFADRDGDDRPDGPAKVVLDGWTTPDHNVFNGLTWGPDGWLYGCHGILGSSFVGVPGTAKSQRQEINCGIWRYHPTRQKFEIVCHGTTNPWGLDFDERGQGFFTNCVIGHLWHMIPGARYRRMYGEHFNPHLYRLIDSCADHRHWQAGDWKSSRFGVSHDDAGGGHAHAGCMIYLGDNWPDEYRGSIFTCNLHGNRVNRDRLQRQGSGYVGSHANDFMLANNAWFRGLELVYGPDGGVYISDWADFGECHDNDGVHRSSGRIYKVMHEPAKRIPSDFDLSRKSNEQLVQLQTHRNAWFARRARLLLQQRASDSPASAEALHPGLAAGVVDAQADVVFRLRCLWILHVTSQLDSTLLISLLSDDLPDVRAWAIRLLTDDAVPAAAREPMARLAATEGSPFVRLHLASALPRLADADRWLLAEALLTQHEPADEQLTLMTWYGIEPLVPTEADRALRLAVSSLDGTVREFIMRRLASSTAADVKSGTIIGAILDQSDSSKQIELLDGLQHGIRVRESRGLSAAWRPAGTKLYASHDPQVRRLAGLIGLVLNDPTARRQIQQVAADVTASVADRREAIQALGEEAHADLAKRLIPFLDDPEVRETAITALANANQPRVSTELLSRYSDLNANERQAAVATLATRAPWALAMLDAIAEGRVAASDVTDFQIRQMKLMKQRSIDLQIRKIWPIIRQSPAEKKQQIAKFKSILGDDFLLAGNPARGRVLYRKSCASCHKLFDDGGTLGPELTGSGRKNIDYILQNVVDPSATLAESYRMSVVETEDGNTLSGIVADRGNDAIELRTPESTRVLKRSEIAEITPSQQSPMPDGLLGALNEQQLRDLVAYLYSDHQVALPQSEELRP